MNSNFEKLHNYFKTFPGIGKRQAERFVYHVLSQDSSWVNSFIREVGEIKKTVSECRECFYIFKNNGFSVCEFCTAQTRNNTMLAIVEKSSDIEILVQKTNFNGRFFVLGGQIPVIEKKKRSAHVRIDELLLRIKKLSQNTVNQNTDPMDFKKDDEMLKNTLEEIIICTSYNPDGVFTASVIKDRIREAFENKFKVTTFGRGFSSGTELEYADQETLRYALENRTKL